MREDSEESVKVSSAKIPARWGERTEATSCSQEGLKEEVGEGRSIDPPIELSSQNVSCLQKVQGIKMEHC